MKLFISDSEKDKQLNEKEIKPVYFNKLKAIPTKETEITSNASALQQDINQSRDILTGGKFFNVYNLFLFF